MDESFIIFDDVQWIVICVYYLKGDIDFIMIFTSQIDWILKNRDCNTEINKNALCV